MISVYIMCMNLPKLVCPVSVPAQLYLDIIILNVSVA